MHPDALICIGTAAIRLLLLSDAFATGVAPRHEEDVSGIWEGWQAYSALLVMSCDGVLGKAFKAHPVAKESPRPDWRDAVRPSAYPAAGAIPQRHREA